jgi:hypothetical protein
VSRLRRFFLTPVPAAPAVAAAAAVGVCVAILRGGGDPAFLLGVAVAAGGATTVAGIVIKASQFSLVDAVSNLVGHLRRGERERPKNPFTRPRRRPRGNTMTQVARSPLSGRLAAVLVHGAVLQLPHEQRERWAEEWAEHGAHRTGWRLLWWALCLRATAARTGREYRRVQVPLGGK